MAHVFKSPRTFASSWYKNELFPPKSKSSTAFLSRSSSSNSLALGLNFSQARCHVPHPQQVACVEKNVSGKDFFRGNIYPDTCITRLVLRYISRPAFM